MNGDSSWLQEMIDRSFNAEEKGASRPKSKTTRVLSQDQHRERFLMEMSGVEPPVKVKAELGNELEVVDGRGHCFYIDTGDFLRP